MHVGSGKTIMLQTAQAIVFNTLDPNRQSVVRLLLDTGSQNSYITESVCNELKLGSKGKRNMSIMTFGSEAPTSQSCNIREVGMETKGGLSKALSLSMLSVPFICEPLYKAPLQACIDRYPYLKGLDLADSLNDSSQMQPDILIGLGKLSLGKPFIKVMVP